MARIIPGVQVTVVKEVIPPQLAPSGVLGLIGLTEKLDQVERAASWSRFIAVCGSSAAYSLPEARQVLANGVFELVIAPVKSTVAQAAVVTLPAATGNDTVLTLEARAPGSWANGFVVRVIHRAGKFDLEVRASAATEPLEVQRNLVLDSIGKELQSGIVRVTDATAGALPKDGDYPLADGKDATPADYIDALKRLEDEPDVDLVLAAVQDFSTVANVTKIYSEVISHCQRMSEDSKGRIGFGQTPPGSAPVKDFTDMASTLLSDRFVLAAPHGVAGAVAGRVGNLSYFQSPTFKQLAGSSTLSRALTIEEQQTLLKGNVVPIINQRGRGIIILRGLTTDGDQISVRRVADRAVRGVKAIGELFIGRLNNEDGRGALKQKLTEFLVQMEKDGAIVPSTDGKDPAFKVDVYSSQADFAQGIVRVDIAVRPVRAIDFIYATILVQV